MCYFLLIATPCPGHWFFSAVIATPPSSSCRRRRHPQAAAAAAILRPPPPPQAAAAAIGLPHLHHLNLHLHLRPCPAPPLTSALCFPSSSFPRPSPSSLKLFFRTPPPASSPARSPPPPASPSAEIPPDLLDFLSSSISKIPLAPPPDPFMSILLYLYLWRCSPLPSPSWDPSLPLRQSSPQLPCDPPISSPRTPPFLFPNFLTIIDRPPSPVLPVQNPTSHNFTHFPSSLTCSSPRIPSPLQIPISRNSPKSPYASNPLGIPPLFIREPSNLST